MRLRRTPWKAADGCCCLEAASLLLQLVGFLLLFMLALVPHCRQLLRLELRCRLLRCVCVDAGRDVLLLVL
jgi:hypothetical protein